MGAFGGSSSDWGDYDGDGDLDLLVSGWNANMEPATVRYRTGRRQALQWIDARLMGVNDGMARWVDYDNNNRLDIMVSGANAKQQAVSRLYKNEPDTSFISTDIALEGTWRSSFSWGDYNNDGYQDVAITGADYYNERITVIYHNLLGENSTGPAGSN
ncbi:MAG: VCBS repeat-containing protein [Fodinibius sp.]|nr:VCBS repeat-containing protein [Fodinibius sp.]